MPNVMEDTLAKIRDIDGHMRHEVRLFSKLKQAEKVKIVNH